MADTLSPRERAKIIFTFSLGEKVAEGRGRMRGFVIHRMREALLDCGREAAAFGLSFCRIPARFAIQREFESGSFAAAV
jgi:hypothetical protein